MIVNAQTKISKLINENPEAIDVIASINKHFKKLKNPVLRKLLAPRVSVSEAARIGGATVEEFLNRLKSIGFEVDYSFKNTEMNFEAGTENKMEEINKRKLVSMDVRPDIARGEDPFKLIMGLIKTLPDDSVLEIINVFEPIPLISHLKDKGYSSLTERPEENVVNTYFWKTGEVKADKLPDIKEVEEPTFEEKLEFFGDKIITLDVRGLEMPEPMMNVLIETEKLPDGYGLYVHHQRIPQYLLPELKKRGLNILHYKEDENNVKLLIHK